MPMFSATMIKVNIMNFDFCVFKVLQCISFDQYDNTRVDISIAMGVIPKSLYIINDGADILN